MTVPPVIIISLATATARRAAIAAQLQAMNVAYSFFDGVVGADVDMANHPAYARTLRHLFFGRDLAKGEFGCLLSHRGVCEHIVANDIPCAIVLEDDAIVSPDFPAVVEALQRSPVKWDMVRFLGRAKVYRKARFIAPLFGKYEITRPAGTPGGAYGYMLTRHAAKRLLKCLRRNFLPVDTVHGQVWRTGLEALAVRPSPVLPDEVVPSSIGDARFDKTVRTSGLKSAIFPLTRFAWKIYDAICTSWVLLRTWPGDCLKRSNSCNRTAAAVTTAKAGVPFSRITTESRKNMGHPPSRV